MSQISVPDLIVNEDGSVYHIGMKPEDLADTVILVGDPNRVRDISCHFTGIEHEASNREFVSATGYFNGKRLTALSTGIGTDNCDIVMHELDALANFDLPTRTRNEKLRSLTIVRVGTSGAIQPDVPVMSVVVSTHALGLDNLLYFYKDGEKVFDKEMAEAFDRENSWPASLSKPYFVKASDRLVKRVGEGCVSGITVTAPGFYGPQGRFLRLPLADPGMREKLERFTFNGSRVINFEMETSALYGLGALMGHEMATLCTVIANRATGEYNPDYKTGVRRMIETLLNRLTV